MTHIYSNQNKDVNGKNITVIGLGKSGQGAAQLAHFLGASVFVSEGNSNPCLLYTSPSPRDRG